MKTGSGRSRTGVGDQPCNPKPNLFRHFQRFAFLTEFINVIPLRRLDGSAKENEPVISNEMRDRSEERPRVLQVFCGVRGYQIYGPTNTVAVSVTGGTPPYALWYPSTPSR
jgi:hypothetical protein